MLVPSHSLPKILLKMSPSVKIGCLLDNEARAQPRFSREMPDHAITASATHSLVSNNAPFGTDGHSHTVAVTDVSEVWHCILRNKPRRRRARGFEIANLPRECTCHTPNMEM